MNIGPGFKLGDPDQNEPVHPRCLPGTCRIAGTPAEPDPVPRPADVEALTDHERRVILSRVPLAQGRDDDEIIASVEWVLSTRLDAVRRKAASEALTEAADEMPFGYSHAAHILRARAARIARESR